MPELPEVETVVREIAPRLMGRAITGVKIEIPRQLVGRTPRMLAKLLTGTRILNVTRRGKYIVIGLERGTLLIHLRMSGRLYVRKEKDTAQTHERAHVQLDKGNAILVLRDVRTLGTIQYFAADEVITPLAKLGWEPLSEEVSATEFRAALRGRKSAIKPVLLDQTLWAGIGNIYAAEALWEARIDPRLRANQLSLKRCDLLGEVIVKVLRRALSKGGSTLRDFMSPEGNAGEYSGEFRVYGREGESCYRCGATIKRIVQAQRATFYCAGCQKMKG